MPPRKDTAQAASAALSEDNLALTTAISEVVTAQLAGLSETLSRALEQQTEVLLRVLTAQASETLASQATALERADERAEARDERAQARLEAFLARMAPTPGTPSSTPVTPSSTRGTPSSTPTIDLPPSGDVPARAPSIIVTSTDNPLPPARAAPATPVATTPGRSTVTAPGSRPIMVKSEGPGDSGGEPSDSSESDDPGGGGRRWRRRKKKTAEEKKAEREQGERAYGRYRDNREALLQWETVRYQVGDEDAPSQTMVGLVFPSMEFPPSNANAPVPDSSGYAALARLCEDFRS
ncbi:hypothetical protein SEUCBS139899_010770 [Sporothrix eucalyptigena]